MGQQVLPGRPRVLDEGAPDARRLLNFKDKERKAASKGMGSGSSPASQAGQGRDNADPGGGVHLLQS